VIDRPPEEPWLLALAATVSEGGAVDWPAARAQAADPAARALVEELQLVSLLVAAHASLAGAQPSADQGPSDAAPAHRPRTWRNLLVLTPVASGVFGDVYRGWDTQLDREVAIKFLRDRGADAATSLREARLLARIRHPNVVTVYGAEHEHGESALWMEFIEGETLADVVVRRGPMSAWEAAGVGIDVCRAVSALHGDGLVHRDIKASNVMREVGGRVVLMDFGGAHARDTQAADVQGTPLYMAPEFLAGDAASPASDVYAIGVLLYFLLSARHPVEGETVADLAAAHQAGRRTRLRDARADLPDALVRVVERATAHDPDQRYDTVGELEHALSGTLGERRDAAGTDRAADAGAATRWGWWAGGLAALVIVGAAVLASLAARGRSPAIPTMPVRFSISPSPLEEFTDIALSPDGRTLILGSEHGLRVRPLGSDATTTIPGSSGGIHPFWSPDSSRLAFFRNSELVIADLRGTLRSVGPARGPVGGTWGADDAILFAGQLGGAIFKVPAAGGQPVPIRRLEPGKGQQALRWPHFLPDGRRFLYFIRSYNPAVQGIYLGSADATDASADVRVLSAESNVQYSRGHILFASLGSLLAAPFDTRTGRMTGAPLRIADHIDHEPYSDGFARFAVSAAGALAFKGGFHPNRELRWFDRSGRDLGSALPVGEYRDFELSHDGQRLAVSVLDPLTGMQDVWLHDLTRQMALRLTNSPAHDAAPVWSPHGDRLAFGSTRDGRIAILEELSSGAGTETVLFTGPAIAFDWSPDGRWLAAQVYTARGDTDVVLLPAAGTGPSRSFTQRPTMEGEPQFSPDGRWLMYSTLESGPLRQVFIEPLEQDGARFQVSTIAGREPRWRADSREVFFLGPDSTIMAAAVTERGAGLKVAPPTALFAIRAPDRDIRHRFAVSPDGQRFLVNVIKEDALGTPIRVSTDWFATDSGAPATAGPAAPL
jgi:eukaryotic-like serine/threonine-protein kinase